MVWFINGSVYNQFGLQSVRFLNGSVQTGSSLLTVRCKRFFCQFKRFRVGTGFGLDTVRFFFGSVFFQFGLYLVRFVNGFVFIRFNIIRVDSVSGLLKYGSGRFSVSKKNRFLIGSVLIWIGRFRAVKRFRFEI